MASHYTPSCPVRKDSVLQFSLSGDERNSTVQWNVIDSPVPDGSVDHAIRGKREEGTNNGTSKAVVPVVKLINGKSACDQCCSENWGVDGNQFPHCWVVVGEKLQLGIQV